MTTLSAPWWGRLFGARPTDSTTPDLKRRAPPVLIHDAITPWHGETLLLKLMRDAEEARVDQS